MTNGHLIRPLVPLVLLAMLASCAAQQALRNPDNEKFSIEVKVLSPVDEYFDSFTNVSIVTSFVWVEVLEPQSSRKDRVRLILQSGEEKRYKRLPVGALWRDVGSICNIEVVINKRNSEYYLYPPLNIPLSDVPF